MTWSFEFSFDVDTNHRIIYEKIFGIWRRETAEAYHEAFVEAVQPLIERPWAKLVDLSHWKTSYPDMVKVLSRHLVWCKDHNMVLSVNVLDNTSTFRQLNEMFTGGGTAEISVTFRTRPQAERYLREVWIDGAKQNGQ